MNPVRRLYPNAAGWRRVLLVTTTAGLGTACVTGAAGAVFGGWPAAASAVIGGLGVVIFCFISLALIDWSDRHAPRMAMPLFMVAFGLKVAGLAVVVTFVQPAAWMQPGWSVASSIAVLIVWQAAEIASFAQMRMSVDPSA